MKKRRYRVTEERLMLLMDKTNAMSDSDMMRDALQVYEWFVEEREKGNRICSVDPDGNLETVEFE